MKDQAGCLKPMLVMMVMLLIAVGARYQWAHTLPVRNFPAPLPTPSPNGFDIYVKAANAVVNSGGPVDPIYDAHNLSPAEAATQYSLGRRQQWLRENAGAFQTFKQAMATPSLVPSRRGPSPSMLPFSPLRSMARYKIVQANTLEMEGQWRQAADARLDCLEMGLDIERGGDVLASFVSAACQAIALNDFSQLIPHLTAIDCRELCIRIEKLNAGRTLFSNILTEDKVVAEIDIVRAWTERDAGKKGIINPTPGNFIKAPFTSRRRIFDENEKVANAFIAVADKPLLLAKPNLPAPSYPQSEYLPTTHLMSSAIFNEARAKAITQITALRLALRAYRLDKGSYPGALAQLTPTYLAKIPTDPFGSGGPWLYKKSGDSFLVWSIGPDGKDDGGKSIANKNFRKHIIIMDDSVGDYVATPEAP